MNLRSASMQQLLDMRKDLREWVTNAADLGLGMTEHELAADELKHVVEEINRRNGAPDLRVAV